MPGSATLAAHDGAGARAPPAHVVGVKLWPLVSAVSAYEIEHAPVGSTLKSRGRSRARQRIAIPLWSMVGQSHTLRETPRTGIIAPWPAIVSASSESLMTGGPLWSRSPCQNRTRQRRQRHRWTCGCRGRVRHIRSIWTALGFSISRRGVTLLREVGVVREPMRAMWAPWCPRCSWRTWCARAGTPAGRGLRLSPGRL